MPPDIGIRTQALVRGALSALFSVIATAAMAQSIQGTATYKERRRCPPERSLRPRSKMSPGPTHPLS
jgi:hypothetical protein